MANAGHGTSYRVEVRDRDLTGAETERVAEELRASERLRKRGQNDSRWLRHPWVRRLVLAAASAIVWRQNEPLALAVLGLVVLETILTTARAKKLARAKSPIRGPWAPPPEGWTVRETHVVARAVVRAAGGYEELGTWTWLLFEVPGGEWFYIRVEAPYRMGSAEEFARADLVLNRLWPHGPVLDAIATGEPLPILGVSDHPDDDAAVAEAEWTWNPVATYNDTLGRLRREDDGVVRVSDLPPGVLAAVGRPTEA